MKPFVILIHGLNCDPRRMRPLAHALASDFETEILALPGHDGTSTKTVLATRLLDALRMKLIELSSHGRPIFIIGFSLGGLLATVLLAKESFPLVKGLYGIAPGFVPHHWRLYAKLAHVLSLIPFPVPTLGPRNWKLHRWIFPGLFKALFDLVADLHAIPEMSGLREVRGRVIFHKSDLLVSASESKRWVEKYTNWEFSDRLVSQSNAPLFHLIFDPEFLVEDDFIALVEDIRRFLT